MEVALEEAALAEVPDRPAVFLLRVSEGEPYLARTSLLRRRLRRLSRMEKVRNSSIGVQYWLTGSTLESQITMYEQARRLFAE